MFSLKVSFVALAAAVAVSAQTPPFGGQSHISVNLDNDYCLTATGTDNGDAVLIQPCQEGLANQDWTFSGGQVQLYGGEKCLDVTNGAASSGTKLQIWTCYEGNTNQLWQINGDNTIKWAGKPFCLDLTDGSMADGNRVRSELRDQIR